MGRKPKIGLIYFSMDADVVYDTNVKLIYSEFGSDGIWIWLCLLSKIYREKGYYFDLNDRDDLTLFASDVCKKQVSLVEEVIKGCSRRGLFDSSVFGMFNVITSARIQDNYFAGTLERRKGGSVIKIIKEYLVAELPDNDKNLVIIGLNQINPEINSISPEINAESSREESNKVKESKRKEKKESIPAAKATGTKIDKLPDLIDDLIQIWKEEYLISRNDEYVIPNPGKERSAAGTVLKSYKQNPANEGKDTDTAKAELRRFFKNTLSISCDEDKWLYENMNLNTINNQINKIKTILRNRKIKANGTNISTNKKTGKQTFNIDQVMESLQDVKQFM